MSHHHHQHHHHHSNNQNSCNFFNPPSSCCCGTSSCCSATSSSDHQQLLQTLTTQLLLLQPQPQPHLFINTPHPHPQQAPKTKPGPFNNNINNDDDASLLPLLRSLIRRVAALESNLSLSQQPPAQQYQRYSLRHLAAVTIQRRFRRFLARRSRTLNHLKLLASIKSTAAALRSSLADKTLKNPRAMSTQVADLLSKLDSIQSSDAMIREGKRSIQRELVRVSEFVEKVLVREREVRELGEMERRRERVRRVRFVENGDEDKMFDEMLRRELRERGRKERFAENGDEDEVFDESLQSEKESRGFYEMFADGEDSDGVVWNGSNGLSPPLPVKMDA